ncbi:MAG: hypothetical protein FWD73_15190 [Polyangiaceae bacterium]|nr:hypothetical protein [Polyangiaceae bacterium]
MKAFAPGKLVLTGAYAVLEGAPAIVVATSRGVVADATCHAACPTPEVRAALGNTPAPLVNASALFDGDRKLGLGASAAILVASLGAVAIRNGIRDLTSERFRSALFFRAQKAHAEAQRGGSGVDVAASVFGGVLCYTMGALPVRVALPPGIELTTFACQNSARTTDLRARVDALRVSNRAMHVAHLGDLARIAEGAAAAISAGDRRAFIASVADAARSLGRLGAACGAPIVPPGLEGLSELAAREGGAFCVSGAGGGDVAFFVGARPPRAVLERAAALGLTAMDMTFDEKGLRALPPYAAQAATDLAART